MDDKEKSVFESVTDAIKHTINIATEAAEKAMEPEPLKRDEELVVVPTPMTAGSDFMSPTPMPPAFIVVKKKRRASKKPAAKKAPREEIGR